MAAVPSRLYVDCDTGLDDALALAFLGACPEVELIATGSVHGNVGSARAALNTRFVLDRSGSSRVPVFTGAARPLVRAPARINARHAPDGLGGLAPPGTTAGVKGVHAAEQLVRLARSCADEGRALSVLATGPFTNLAVALALEPDLASLVERVVVMGGSFEKAAPAQLRLPESNVGADPEAAAAVFAAGLPLTVVPLDVTRSALLPTTVAERIASAGDVGRFCASLAERYAESYGSCSSQPSCPLHDPLAAAIVVASDLAVSEQVNVRVELCGPSRGTTSSEPVAPGEVGSPEGSAMLVREVDVDRFVSLFALRLSR